MEIRALSVEDVSIVAFIDRSERVHREYEVVHGELTERPVTMTEIPAWRVDGTGFHTVASQVEFCRTRLAAGGRLLGAFDEDTVLGAAIVEPRFDPPLARLSFLYVSRPYRRQGVGSELWRTATAMAKAEGATQLYVSAVPTGSAVSFYLREGCVLAEPPHPLLFDKEPDDIHLVARL